MKENTLGIITIAAGNSSRLGTPKQLVEINGITLLQKTLHLASQFSNRSICVLGYQADRVRLGANVDKFESIFNPNWAQGMGSSIAMGCEYFEHQCDAVMIMLCDQYLLDTDDIKKLFERWQQQPNKIVASEYFENKNGKLVVGAPAIFPRYCFKALKKLKQAGAREIIERNIKDRITISLANAATDLDTKDDLNILLGRNHD